MSTSNRSTKWIKTLIGAAVVAGLGATAAVVAHPGAGFGPQGAGPGGFGPGSMAGKGPGMMMHGGSTGPMAGQQLMTPEERQALGEKMRTAETPEERRKLAEATHAEMEKRAKERDIALPEGHGPRGGIGANAAPALRAPTATEHVH